MREISHYLAVGLPEEFPGKIGRGLCSRQKTLALLGLNFISLVDLAASSAPFSFVREIFQLSITLCERGTGREMRTSNFPSPSLWLCLSGWLNLGRLKSYSYYWSRRLFMLRTTRANLRELHVHEFGSEKDGGVFVYFRQLRDNVLLAGE